MPHSPSLVADVDEDTSLSERADWLLSASPGVTAVPLCCAASACDPAPRQAGDARPTEVVDEVTESSWEHWGESAPGLALFTPLIAVNKYLEVKESHALKRNPEPADSHGILSHGTGDASPFWSPITELTFWSQGFQCSSCNLLRIKIVLQRSPITEDHLFLCVTGLLIAGRYIVITKNNICDYECPNGAHFIKQVMHQHAA